MQNPSENTLLLRASINDAVSTAWSVIRDSELKLSQIEAIKKVAQTSLEDAILTHSRLLDVSINIERVFTELGIVSRGESRSMKYARRVDYWQKLGLARTATICAAVATCIVTTIYVMIF